MLSFMLGLLVGTVCGAGGLLAFSMAAIAAESDRMMPEIQPTLVQPTDLANSVERNNVVPLQAFDDRS